MTEKDDDAPETAGPGRHAPGADGVENTRASGSPGPEDESRIVAIGDSAEEIRATAERAGHSRFIYDWVPPAEARQTTGLGLKFPYQGYPVRGIGTTYQTLVYRPMVPIRILGPGGEALAYGLLDTGADDTLLPAYLIGPLGLVAHT